MKICPLKFSVLGNETVSPAQTAHLEKYCECEKEKCQWWLETQCAMCQIAFELAKFGDYIAIQVKQDREKIKQLQRVVTCTEEVDWDFIILLFDAITESIVTILKKEYRHTPQKITEQLKNLQQAIADYKRGEK